MFVNLPRIIIGTDLCGMIMAPILDAVFIPVSYCAPFGWEFSNQDIQNLYNLKQYFEIEAFPSETTTVKKIRKERQIIRFQNKTIKPKFFLWEIEKYYKSFLTLASKLYDEFTFEQANFSEKTINFYSSKGRELSVQFDKCWIINPSNKFIHNLNLNPEETITGATAHFLYYLELNTDAKDAKALQREYDFEKIDHPLLSKIWWSAPFGPKQFTLTTDPKSKKRVLTSEHITFFLENVNIENIEDETYQIHNIRTEIFNMLAPKYKRVKDRGPSFDRYIKRICLTTNLDIYEDTEDIKFIYYSDKSEIICKKNLDPLFWPESSQRTLMKSIEKTITSLLTNSSPRKILF